MNWSAFFLNPAVVWVLIPITAIVVSGVHGILKLYLRHQERLAMIQQGMNPDALSDPDDDVTNEPTYA